MAHRDPAAAAAATAAAAASESVFVPAATVDGDGNAISSVPGVARPRTLRLPAGDGRELLILDMGGKHLVTLVESHDQAPKEQAEAATSSRNVVRRRVKEKVKPYFRCRAGSSRAGLPRRPALQAAVKPASSSHLTKPGKGDIPGDGGALDSLVPLRPVSKAAITEEAYAYSRGHVRVYEDGHDQGSVDGLTVDILKPERAGGFNTVGGGRVHDVNPGDAVPLPGATGETLIFSPARLGGVNEGGLRQDTRPFEGPTLDVLGSGGAESGGLVRPRAVQNRHAVAAGGEPSPPSVRRPARRVGSQPARHGSSRVEISGPNDLVQLFSAFNISEGAKLEDDIEKWFAELLETGDRNLEAKIVSAVNYLRKHDDGQAYEEYMALSEPSSESDKEKEDPDYKPDEDGQGDQDEYCANSGDDDEHDDKKEEEEEEEEEEDDDDDDDDDDDNDDDEDDEDEEGHKDPLYAPDEEENGLDNLDEEEYAQGLAALVPLPARIITRDGVVYVENLQDLVLLNPEYHILGFYSSLTICQKISLWRSGKRGGFDFEPSTTLRYVYRLALLVRGKNPSRKRYAMREPPLPKLMIRRDDGEGWTTDEEGYAKDGWTTDEDTHGGADDDSESEEYLDWCDDDEERWRRRTKRMRRKEAETMEMDWSAADD